jgi:chemotaxis methyl-accepting protein methylase
MSYDILQPPSIKTPMQVIRAMNVLNPAYFDLKKLNKVVSHLFHALAEGGLLIVGSNGDAGTDVRGGIYKRVGHQFVVLMQNDLTYYPHQSLCEFRS